jgi:hypothetical protein
VCLHPAAILRADASRQAAMRARWVDCLRRAGEHVQDGTLPGARGARVDGAAAIPIAG